MNTLRAKIALLLVTTIVTVVVCITVATMYVFRAPDEEVVDLLARQLILMQRLAINDPLGKELSAVPENGSTDDKRTAMFRDLTARLGTPLDIVITRKEGLEARRFQTASVRVESRGWLIVDLDPPPDIELVWWLLFITIGVGGVGVLAANRMIRPLVMLESAVEMVNPDGVLPELPERGPAEVRATARALNLLSARLKRAMESRMRLIAGAGHDFRTPLTRMSLRAEFIENEEERELWFSDIKELDHIADSAIELVRGEITEASSEIICMEDLVQSVTTELRHQKFEIEIHSTAKASVQGNRVALMRALRNLLINAATHGKRGTVSVVGGKTARITICDEGPGIPADLMDQVFEPFFRADPARAQNIPGAGLGLSISRDIIRKAGGDIKISNKLGGGLLQVVELPTV
ncbi:ATP-binding protein [Tardiphaga sp. 172_B4_N1_3]|uniref:ATP-binding protein n=1 Tax=Tardiphaga sp. 172_B4_N1_3 TaxID=3240787 RepID=UPI003F8946D5